MFHSITCLLIVTLACSVVSCEKSMTSKCLSLSLPSSLTVFLPVLLFPFSLQDSDSPRHSTASNSSTFSSPPSPASPHKTKSLSLESTDRMTGWDT